MNITTFLRDSTVSEVAKPQKIAWLSASDTLEDALQVLDAKGILSAPIIEEDSQKIIGVLDMYDIVIFILRAMGLSPNIDFDSIPVGYLESLEVDGKLIAKTSLATIVENVTNFRSPAATEVVEPTRPLQSIMDLFVSGVERVLVAEDGQVIGMYSQSDMISLIAQSMYLIGLKKKRTIADLNLARGPMVTVSTTTRVLSALKEMFNQGVPAVGIVLESGRLIGNFSASNLKGIKSDEFVSLHMSVIDFLHNQRFKERPLLTKMTHAKALHPATIFPQDTLEHAILMMTASRVHRLWVVKDDLKPMGVLTIADLLRVVICADMELV